MGTLVQASKTTEFKDGMMKDVLIKGREILLTRIGNNYYATDNRCPHMRGRLSDGILEGTVVTCPRHGSRFDIRNGEVIRWLKGSGLTSIIGKALKSPRPIITYKVKLEGESVLVEI